MNKRIFKKKIKINYIKCFNKIITFNLGIYIYKILYLFVCMYESVSFKNGRTDFIGVQPDRIYAKKYMVLNK